MSEEKKDDPGGADTQTMEGRVVITLSISSLFEFPLPFFICGRSCHLIYSVISTVTVCYVESPLYPGPTPGPLFLLFIVDLTIYILGRKCPKIGHFSFTLIGVHGQHTFVLRTMYLCGKTLTTYFVYEYNVYCCSYNGYCLIVSSSAGNNKYNIKQSSSKLLEWIVLLDTDYISYLHTK